MKRREGSVLVGLLWCVAILSVIVVGALYSTRMSLISTKNYSDKIQAHYLALAGVERAKALLYHDAADRVKGKRNHSGELYNAPSSFRETEFGRGEFSVIRQGSAEEGGGIIFGIRDEESRLNVNTCGADELMKALEMPPETAAAIMDWRDRDSAGSPGGAEKEYYAALKPPYLPRNAEFQTIRELLLVRGVTAAQLLGEDVNQNELLDPEENDGNENYPPDNQNGVLDTGWAGILTVNSQTVNKSAGGVNRINIKSASDLELAGIPGITSDLAKAIVAFRGQNQFENITDLLEVTALGPAPGSPGEPSRSSQANQPGQPFQPRQAPQENQPGPQNQNQPPQGGQRQPVGPKLISEDLFAEIADDVTTDDASTQKGLININTAPVIVLKSLNGMTEELARAVVNQRQSSGFYANIAGILKAPGMTRDIFKQIAPRITARSETFRIVSEGRVRATGARERMEVVVRMSGSIVDTLYYRENL